MLRLFTTASPLPADNPTYVETDSTSCSEFAWISLGAHTVQTVSSYIWIRHWVVTTRTWGLTCERDHLRCWHRCSFKLRHPLTWPPKYQISVSVYWTCFRHDSDTIVHFKKTQGKSFVWITYLYLNFRYWNFSRRRKSWLPKYCCIGISKFSFRERLC